MKNFPIALLIFSALAFTQTERELAHIHVHEWGVLTWNNGTAVLASVPAAPAPEQYFPGQSQDSGEVLLRAPVLYFHGPAFSGTVTVKTANGSIFDIYPPVPDEDRDNSHVSWTADFSYDPIEEYPDFHGMAPGEWNYDLWRIDSPLSITRDDGWADKFLYYETAPATTDFLPYRPGVESLCDEYMDIEAILIKNTEDHLVYSHCTLRDIVYGGDIEDLEMSSNGILGILYGWSVGSIDFEEVDVLWNTWSSWILSENVNESAYSNGLVMYLIPAELTENLSIIGVTTDTPHYPIDISRYLLVAMPL